MKPFKTHNQQLKILRERGLIVQSRNKRDLENENYYNIVNGYKDLFLEVDQKGDFLFPEKYKEGTSFDELFGLFKFDRRLRNIVLEYILVFETNVKSRISYHFSEKHKEPHSYLYFKNYSSDPDKLDKIVGLIANLSNTLKQKKKRPLRHYIENYNGVPLWILVNYLTLGNISYMYSCLEDELRIKIALDYADKFRRDYNQKIHFTPEDLDTILELANHFRNVCAHEERLYDFTVRNRMNYKNLINNYNNTFNINLHPSLLKNNRLFSLLFVLKFVLNKNDVIKLSNNIERTLEYYSKDFATITENDILMKMGFISNAHSILRNR